MDTIINQPKITSTSIKGNLHIALGKMDIKVFQKLIPENSYSSGEGNLHTGKGNLHTGYVFTRVIYKFQTVCKLPSNAIRILYRLQLNFRRNNANFYKKE